MSNAGEAQCESPRLVADSNVGDQDRTSPPSCGVFRTSGSAINVYIPGEQVATFTREEDANWYFSTRMIDKYRPSWSSTISGETSTPFTPKGDASEAAIESKIQAKGLNAPRLKPADIDAIILDHTFTVLPSGKCMVCEIVLVNGFSVRGESSSVSRENFNEEIGREVSYQRARNQIWQLEGYLLQDRLWRAKANDFS